MNAAQRRKLNLVYWGSLAAAVGIVLFGFVTAGFEVPALGYYWASLITVITGTGRRIYDALDIIHTQENP